MFDYDEYDEEITLESLGDREEKRLNKLEEKLDKKFKKIKSEKDKIKFKNFCLKHVKAYHDVEEDFPDESKKAYAICQGFIKRAENTRFNQSIKEAVSSEIDYLLGEMFEEKETEITMEEALYDDEYDLETEVIISEGIKDGAAKAAKAPIKFINTQNHKVKTSLAKHIFKTFKYNDAALEKNIEQQKKIIKELEAKIKKDNKNVVFKYIKKGVRLGLLIGIPPVGGAIMNTDKYRLLRLAMASLNASQILLAQHRGQKIDPEEELDKALKEAEIESRPIEITKATESLSDIEDEYEYLISESLEQLFESNFLNY